MLGADVVVAQLQRLAERQLEDLLGAGSERDVPAGGRAALADDLLDLGAHRLQGDPELLEGLGGHPFALVDESEQDVLGADVVVVQQARFFLRQHHNPSGSVCESFEQGGPPPGDGGLLTRKSIGERPTSGTGTSVVVPVVPSPTSAFPDSLGDS